MSPPIQAGDLERAPNQRRAQIPSPWPQWVARPAASARFVVVLDTEPLTRMQPPKALLQLLRHVLIW